MELELYDWQKEALKEFEKNNFNGILKVATGKGKTVFAIACIEKLKERNNNLKTLIIVPTLTLMNQWKNEIEEKSQIGFKIGVFSGLKKDDPTDKDIMIFVINSAVIDDNLKNIHKTHKFDFLIADECHHYGAPYFSKILENKFEFKLALSATPERDYDKEGNAKIFDNFEGVFYEISHLDDPDAIPPLTICGIGVNFDSSEEEKFKKIENAIKVIKEEIHKKYPESLKENIIEFLKKKSKKCPICNKLQNKYFDRANFLSSLNNKKKAVKEIERNIKKSSNKIIVFNQKISAIEDIYDLLYGISNVYKLHSQLSKEEQEKSKLEFKEKEKAIIVVGKMADEGWDVKDADVAIIVGFSKSSRQYIQRLGRILRKPDDKKRAIIYTLFEKNESDEQNKYLDLLVSTDLVGYRDQSFTFNLFDGNDIISHPYEDLMIRKLKNIKEINERLNLEGLYINNERKMKLIKDIDNIEKNLKSGINNKNKFKQTPQEEVIWFKYKSFDRKRINLLLDNNKKEWPLFRREWERTYKEEDIEEHVESEEYIDVEDEFAFAKVKIENIEFKFIKKEEILKKINEELEEIEKINAIKENIISLQEQLQLEREKNEEDRNDIFIEQKEKLLKKRIEEEKKYESIVKSLNELKKMIENKNRLEEEITQLENAKSAIQRRYKEDIIK